MKRRYCQECHGRFTKKEGRLCLVAPVEGHSRADWVCDNCRALIASEKRAEARKQHDE